MILTNGFVCDGSGKQPSTILTYCGKTLAELAGEKTVEEFCMEALMESTEQSAAFKSMSEENMRLILAEPWVCTGSDAGQMPLDNPDEKAHTRAVGTFPLFFRFIAAKHGVAEAIRRMTSLPAEIFRIEKRGRIQKGFFADLVILDTAKFNSPASFHNPSAAPEGIARIIVNGKIAWDAASPEKITRAGRPL